MDPMSIVTLLQFGNKVSQAIVAYIKRVRRTPDIVRNIERRVHAWSIQLEALGELEQDGDLTENTRTWLHTSGILDRSYDCLTELNTLIEKAPRPNREYSIQMEEYFKRLAWPLVSSTKAGDLLAELDRQRDEIADALVVDTATNLCALRREVQQQVEAQVSDRQKQDIIHWLQPPFDSVRTEPVSIHIERTKLREPGTCEWMTSCTHWKDWLRGGSPSPQGYRRFLWVHGLPGSGKTILASYLNDQLALHCGAIGCSYYYCLYEHNRDETESFLRHTIRDFCIQLGRFIPEKLYEMFKYKKIHVDDLLECLRIVTLEVLKRFGKRTYIVVDAIDESRSSRNAFLHVLMTIGTKPAFSQVSLLMTSREEPDIKRAIKDLSQMPMSYLIRSGSTLDVSIRTTPHPSNELRSALRNAARFPTAGDLGAAVGLRPLKQRARVISEPPVSLSASSPSLGDMTRLDTPRSTRAFSTYDKHDVDASDTPVCSKRQLSGPQESRSPSPQKRKVSAGGSHVEVKPEHKLDNEAGDQCVFPCSVLSMSNPFVKKAIEKVIEERLEASGRFGQWPREDFVPKLRMKLAAKAGGIFRAVACHLDLISRQQSLIDDDQILAAIDQFPETLFDQYEQIIVTGIPHAGSLNSHNRDFARTALALTCSDTAEIPDVNVLVEASRFNVPQGKAQAYNLEKLSQLLGCLVKVTRLRQKAPTLFARNDDASDFQRLTIAHFTVKEFLYHEKTAQGPARDFALSKETNRRLELKIIFYGLQQFLPDRKQPTKYEEYCIKMTDDAIRKRPAFIVKDREIWESVHQCLAWNDPHQVAVKRNKATRDALPTWNKLATAFLDGQTPDHRHTCIVVSLLLLQWPKLAEIYLGSLQDEQRDEIWYDSFILRDSDATTVLEMCVSNRQVDFLDIFVQAGATFKDAEGILFRALEDPYSDGEGRNDDGSTTGRIIRTLLERGADPNTASHHKWTLLQVAARQLEHSWVQELLYYRANPITVFEPEDSNESETKGSVAWYHKAPLDICRTTKPEWGESEEDWNWSRSRVEQLLTAALVNAGMDAGQSGAPRKVHHRREVEVIVVEDD